MFFFDGPQPAEFKTFPLLEALKIGDGGGGGEEGGGDEEGHGVGEGGAGDGDRVRKEWRSV